MLPVFIDFITGNEYSEGLKARGGKNHEGEEV